MKKGQGKRIWLTPILLALPFAAATGIAVLIYGPKVRDLIDVAIKLVVTK